MQGGTRASQAPTADFDSPGGLSGLPTTFDGSSSAATCGAIASYTWDFGDGSVETTATPTVEHVYEKAGTYDATLTVADAAGTSTSKVFTGRAMLRNGGPEAELTQEVTIGQGPVVAPPHFTG